MSLDNNWFTEQASPTECAFSLHIKDKLHEEETPFQEIAIYDTTEFGILHVLLTENDHTAVDVANLCADMAPVVLFADQPIHVIRVWILPAAVLAITLSSFV